jgi:hypothetical protein
LGETDDSLQRHKQRHQIRNKFLARLWNSSGILLFQPELLPTKSKGRFFSKA